MRCVMLLSFTSFVPVAGSHRASAFSHDLVWREVSDADLERSFRAGAAAKRMHTTTVPCGILTLDRRGRRPPRPLGPWLPGKPSPNLLIDSERVQFAAVILRESVFSSCRSLFAASK